MCTTSAKSTLRPRQTSLNPCPIPWGETGGVFLLTGQSNASSVPTGLNPGWDPYGASDTTHEWIDIGNGYTDAVYDYSGSTLEIVWGSPNAAPSGDAGSQPGSENNNIVKFFNAAETEIGEVGDLDLFNAFNIFSPFVNTSDPGYLITFTTSQPFASVQFSTSSSAFEFADPRPLRSCRPGR